MFFCRFAATFINFLNEVKNDSYSQSSKLRNLYTSNYETLVIEPSLTYKNRNDKFGSDRYYYKLCIAISIILIAFNSFILAIFFDNIGGLSTPILIDPIQISYSHLIAAVIVFAEIMTGAIYYIAYQRQQKTEDPIYTLLKFFAIFGFISLMIVETIMWANLSVLFEMSDRLSLGARNAFRNFVDYFLSVLGIAFTLIEFAVGYFSSQFRKSKGDSTILFQGRFILLTIGLIILLYLPNVLLIVFGALLAIIVTLINFIVLPGNYIYEKIFINKKSSSSSI